jgi:thermosome
MLAQGTPVIVLREGTEESKGRSAQENNVQAAVALADMLRPTLGPRGLDKMLVDALGDATITNDGATILEKLEVRHPAAKMVVEVALAQDKVAGDGTKSAVILAGDLLKHAQELITSGVHATVVASGYMEARRRAAEALEKVARPVNVDDEALLLRAAETSMASKIVSAHRAALARLCVKAAREVAQERGGRRTVDLDDVAVVKAPGGGVEASELVEGVILDKEPAHPEMERHVEAPAIAIVSVPLAVKKTEVEAHIKIVEPRQMEAFVHQEERYLERLVADVRACGATVLVSSKEVDPAALEMLAREGVVAIPRVAEADLDRLAKASGGTVVARFDDLDAAALGHAGRLDWRKEGGKRYAFVTACAGAKAVTLFVRGGTEHVVDEVERSCRDGLAVVRGLVEEGLVLPGGGASAVEAAVRLREMAPTVGGREQLAVEAFADALEAIPRALAHNAGQDPIDVLLALRRAHARGQTGAGVDLKSPQPADMWEAGIVEPIRVVRQELESATEAAVMILRIDDVIAAKRQAGGAGHAGRPSPQGMD